MIYINKSYTITLDIYTHTNLMISILNNLLVNNHSTLEKLCYVQTENLI